MRRLSYCGQRDHSTPRRSCAASTTATATNRASPPTLPAPYERLLGDALDGDPSLFAREDTVEAAWRIVEPVLDDAVAVHQYRPGTWGPHQAARLAPGGWHDPAPRGAAR